MIARDVLIVVCGISAGIHAALAPEHFAEGAGAGVGFVAAAVGLAVFAVVLTLRPPNAATLAGSAVLLAGLIVSYALAISSGLPFSIPSRSRSTRSQSPRRRSRPPAWLLRSTCSGSAGAESRSPSLVRKESSREHSSPSSDPARADHADRALQRPGGACPLRRARRPRRTARRRITLNILSALSHRQELTLRNNMRKLWEDHVTWTRHGRRQPRRRLAGHEGDRRPAPPQPDRHRQRDQTVLRPGRGRRAHEGAPDAHPDRRRPDRRRQGRRPAQVAAEQARWRANAADIATLLSRANPPLEASPRSWRCWASTCA